MQLTNGVSTLRRLSSVACVVCVLCAATLCERVASAADESSVRRAVNYGARSNDDEDDTRALRDAFAALSARVG